MRHFLLSTAIRSLPVAFVGVVHPPQGPIPVKVIQGDDGPIRINAEDFNPNEHTEFKGSDTHNPDGTLKVAGQPEQQSQAQPGMNNPQSAGVNSNDDGMTVDELKERVSKAAFGVAELKIGRKKPAFYVVDTNISSDDKRVDDIDGIDANGYPTNAEAWAAVTAVQTKING